jgi:DNA-binding transcriptional MerR regulator
VIFQTILSIGLVPVWYAGSPNLIPIGRFARITHFSVKALRLYAEEGLLSPVSVDPVSEYRYSTLAQVALAARIRLWRMVEMPLEEIRAVVQAPDEQTARTWLERHHQRLMAWIAEQHQATLLLERVLEKPKEQHIFGHT